MGTPAGKYYRQKINYYDNPHFPDELRVEMEKCKAERPDEYLNIWEGYPRVALKGAVYQHELRAAQTRIMKVPHEVGLPVHVYWDLGYADFMCAWFIQFVGFEIHIIDFHCAQFKGLPYYYKMLKEKDYFYHSQYLPHDGAHNNIHNGGVNIVSKFKLAGFSAVSVERPTRKAIPIAILREAFPKFYFDAEKCAEGLNYLEKYAYDERDGQFSDQPKHDVNSHAADALTTFAMSAKKTNKTALSQSPEFNPHQSKVGKNYYQGQEFNPYNIAI